jgi:hypothetical protein
MHQSYQRKIILGQANGQSLSVRSGLINAINIAFLQAEILMRKNVATMAAKQKESEEQKLTAEIGKKWCRNNPILCLIYTLDNPDIRRFYMQRHDLASHCMELENHRLVDKRDETVWQMMAKKWNSKEFSPTTMALSHNLHFVTIQIIMFDNRSSFTKATPEKCTDRWSSMLVELQRMIGGWTQSGMGDEDIDFSEDNEEEHGSLKRCSQGALDSRANFLGTSQHYILYFWEFLLDNYDLLKTSFQRLNDKVAARN